VHFLAGALSLGKACPEHLGKLDAGKHQPRRMGERCDTNGALPRLRGRWVADSLSTPAAPPGGQNSMERLFDRGGEMTSRMAAFDWGATHVAKPVEPSELLTVCASLLGRITSLFEGPGGLLQKWIAVRDC